MSQPKPLRPTSSEPSEPKAKQVLAHWSTLLTAARGYLDIHPQCWCSSSARPPCFRCALRIALEDCEEKYLPELERMTLEVFEPVKEEVNE